jgi:NADH dehydrogenase (ubiquinone) Fe-S protein 4
MLLVGLLVRKTNLLYSEYTAKPTITLLAELRHRQVRIYKPTRNTMQSGSGKSNRWRIDFDILQGGGRWENPLMGWASSCVGSRGYSTSTVFANQPRNYVSADYMQGTRLSFRSKEDAMHFAEKQGMRPLCLIVLDVEP